MEKVLFISDLHLKSMQEEKAQILLRFLVSIQPEAKNTTLFLVGDIFDLWLGGHNYFVKKFKPLISEIKKFITAGGKVYYFEGNHDLHLTHFFEWNLGCQVYREAETFLFGETTVRVEHGDQMDLSDKGYLFLRWLLRTSPVTGLILNLPGPVVGKIGDMASQTSRNYTDSKRDTSHILKVMHDHAHAMHDKKPFDAIITGHVHLRDEYHFQVHGKTVKSFNLGCWDDKAMALEFDGQNWKWFELT